jgi:hypothetical protein
MTTPKPNQPKKPTGQPDFIGRPRDKSLEAYKDFVRDFVKALGGKDDQDMSEEQWAADWKAFWE